MRPDVWRVLKVFVTQNEENHVFLSSSGVGLTASEISRYVKAAWKDLGEELKRDIGDISTTMVRRAAITVTRQVNTTHDEQRQLSAAMCHNI
jgi:hypothetical protein